ncbi:MAG: hypothetical protein F6K58_19555 [Symploca sp. SIO2E9]|nr:hypothetical protein [Symploca sp. SIO2E9]
MKTLAASWQEASKSNPCPLCGKTDWCNVADNGNATVCARTDKAPPGWRFVKTAKDGRPIYAVENKEFYQSKHYNPKSMPHLKSKPKNKPAPLPEGVLSLALLLSSALPLERKKRGKKTEIKYPYGGDKWAIRIEIPNPEKPKGYSKIVIPYHTNSKGELVKGKGGEQWDAYRLEEASEHCAGKWVLASEGEECVEAARCLGLSCITWQGASWNLEELKRSMLALKKAGSLGLAFTRDNDKKGLKKAQLIEEAANLVQFPCIWVNPPQFWEACPESGDIADWITAMEGHQREELIKKLEEIFTQELEVKRDCIENPSELLSFGGGNNNGDDGDGGDDDDGGDDGDALNFWRTPVSWNGEIGWFVENESKNPTTGATVITSQFIPKCNFDFAIERELESADGGGLVLTFKRSFDDYPKQIIIPSKDYASVREFEDTLKKAYGTGVVCNLKLEHLKSLLHVRLRNYRRRGGKIYKLIDRYGQQSDGTWVFSDRQFKSNGTSTIEEKSNLVFNPSLGKEDFIPCPELAQKDPLALKRLIDACREFFGSQNINQVLLTMGWTVAGLHSQAIFKHDSCFPLLNLYGEPGSCKTLAGEAALSLVGKNWGQMGMLARVSLSALYEHGSRTGSLPFFLDDPERNTELDEIFKSWYNRKPRRVRGNDQQPQSPLGVITNHVVGEEQAATFSRFVRLPFERVKKGKGNKQSFQKLRAAQQKASGAFSQLLKIGYDPEAIAAIERKLLPYLPLAHARIAQSLAIPLYYAQKLVELTGGSDNLYQWVVDNCCQTENDADNAGDSLQDFIDKILALEAESKTGEWNLKRNHQRNNGKTYTAIYASDVWALVNGRFKPATYNFKSLKPMVVKAGGIINTTVRFDRSQDQRLAYERALINPRTDADGNEIAPKPPDTIPRKAWLLPSFLFEGEGVAGVTDCNPNSVTPENDSQSRLSTSADDDCNYVTKNIEIEIEIETQSRENSNSAVTGGNQTPENPGSHGDTVTEEEEKPTQQGFFPVTENSSTPVTSPEISVTSPVTASFKEPAGENKEQRKFSNITDEASEKPDFDEFPHSTPHAVWGVRKDKALRIKREILAIDCAEDYIALSENPDYSKAELNWVRLKLLSKAQREALTVVVQASSQN